MDMVSSALEAVVTLPISVVTPRFTIVGIALDQRSLKVKAQVQGQPTIFPCLSLFASPLPFRPALIPRLILPPHNKSSPVYPCLAGLSQT